MAADGFSALVLEEKDGKVAAAVQTLPDTALPAGDVTLRVTHTTLNYKDGMILAGVGRLVRNYPHVGGIDFAGEVIDSQHPDWKAGDRAVLTGWRVGENQFGGYAEKARVKGDWLVRLPPGLAPRHAMAIGTAGFTAMLAVTALEAHGLKPGQGEVLVTGAAGGVGGVATAVLAQLGHHVTASTGRAATHGYLQALGAKTVIDRAVLATPSGKPLDAERWAGAVDSVGGTTLATALTQMKYRASVAACGLAGGTRLDTTVLPFLLRGVNLLGIDSVMCPMAQRRAAWSRLARDLPLDRLESMIQSAKLADLPRLASAILKGEVRGRVVVEIG